MRKQLVRETIGSLVPKPVQTFYTAVMKRKEDDHHASHNNVANQYLHLISSSTFIYCYAILATDLTRAMFLGMAALFIRQFGHAVLEPDSHEEEKLLLGYNTRNKTLILISFAIVPLAVIAQAGAWSLSAAMAQVDAIALLWFRAVLTVVFGRVAFLTWKHDLRTALVWFTKLVSDPFTDIVAYFPRRLLRA